MAGLRERLSGLRRAADDDFLTPPAVHEQGRHRADLGELGLRVSLTRSRYPNRQDGDDMYAVTVSRLAMDHRPGDPEVAEVLAAAFGEAASAAVERPGGPLVRLFRVPAGYPAGAPGSAPPP